MNDHPEELLAGYVEGTLGADEHARVVAHLRACDRCREELDLAATARGALASLPELDAPRGIPLGVRRGAKRAPSRAWRLVATAAAAVVLAGGTILVFSQIDMRNDGQAASEGAGQGPAPAAEAPAGDQGGAGSAADEETAATGGGKAASVLAAPPVLPIYVESDRNYLPEDLAPLARRLRDDANQAVKAGLAETATAFFEEFDPDEFIPDVRQAVRCVLADVPPQQLIVPFRIEAATFEGAPAYVATFLQGPAPDVAYDRIVMWVVHRETCGLMSLASQVL